MLERARESGLASDDDAELLIVRTLARAGRSRVYVNGALATVGVLADLLSGEIEVTSQGAHQRLLEPEVQGDLLDAFGELGSLVGAVQAAHGQWRERALALHERRVHAGERARREDQLRFEVEQIERCDPQPDELDGLERERARLGHVERLRGRSSAALEGLERDAGLLEQLARVRAELADVVALDPAVGEPSAALERGQLELSEAARALEQYTSTLEADPERLERVEQRLSELARLQSRYGASVAEILAYAEQARAELEELGGGEQRSAELEAELAEYAQRLEAAAATLQKARRQAGAELALAVQNELRGLDLGSAHFDVRFAPLPAKTAEGFEAPSGPRGLERAVFELSANPGEEARRLRDVASGGELARLLLAVRNALRGAAPGGVLLFDEIDAGIGGRAARRVGERLRALAKSHQTLCITHLAPIAARGSVHYRVDKRVRRGRTVTRVERLDAEARVDELARMSGDGRVTDAARARARELLAG